MYGRSVGPSQGVGSASTGRKSSGSAFAARLPSSVFSVYRSDPGAATLLARIVPRPSASCSPRVTSASASPPPVDDALSSGQSDISSLWETQRGLPFFWCSSQTSRSVQRSSAMSSICSSSSPNRGFGTGVNRTPCGKPEKAN